MKIPVRIIKIAATHASPDGTRYIMNGVCLQADPTGYVRITATDGRRLISIRTAITYNLPVDGVVIPASTVKRFVGDFVEINAAEGGFLQTTCGLRFRPIVGTFPNVGAVVPNLKDYHAQDGRTGINPQFLMQALKAAADIQKSKLIKGCVATHVICKDELSPVVVRTYCPSPLCQEVLVVIMPLRGYEEMNPLENPEWIRKA